ncbi:MAG: DegV family EDD domain-containing protein [Candidatus Aminicenantes bacterium]|nr:MAG: DegV family EDD domain-containing protein [Candidatus Aminicenantes bacterium]
MEKSTAVQIRYLDGLRYQHAVLAGLKEIISHEKELNRINVFPIPDKDTGSNLRKTLAPIIEKFPRWETSINKSSRSIADVAVASALGYSGIIFAQFLSGFAEGMGDYDRAVVENIPKAAVLAVARAYESLENPQEGTVLTVFREWADELEILSSTTNDFVLLLRKSLERALLALKETPQQLEILRKHKVVDAGGKAFIYFLEGIVHFIEKGKLQPVSPQKNQIYIEEKVAPEEKPQFCAECCVRKTNLDRPGLIEKMNSLGENLIFHGSSNFAKFHVMTGNPEEIFSSASQFGEVTSKRIFAFSPDLPTSEKKHLAFVSDTTCDIFDEHIENNDIYFVPVKFQAMDRVYTDKVDIIPEEFYQIMKQSSTPPKTSQPSLMDFSRIYEHLLVHYQSIISFHVSGGLSGTFQTALQAANNIDPQRITVLDGRNISVGLGLIMMEGISARKEGLDVKATLARIKKAIESNQIFIGLPTLKYLVKGGRVTKAKGVIAKVLNINPILSISREGALDPVGKTRGKKNLEKKILDMVFEKIRAAKITHPEVSFSIAVAHTNALELGKRIAERIKETMGQEVSLIMNASPVLGAHAGPGAVGVALLEISR